MAVVRRSWATVRAASEGKGIGFSKGAVGTLFALVLSLAWQLPLEAAPPPDPFKASTSRAAREAALGSIPFDQLDAAGQGKVASVLSDVAIFRRMPVHVIRCDPDLYLFLVRHPDVVINIWEVLGVSKMTMRQTSPNTFEIAEEDGITGTVEYLYRNHDTHLIYVEGSCNGPLFAKPVRGRTLMLLKTGYVREPDGRYYITSRLDAFVHVASDGAELLTRTFQPLVGKVADINFMQTSGFLGSLSRCAEMNHRGMQRLAVKLVRVPPEVRQQFAHLAERVAQKTAALPNGTAATEPEVARRPGQDEIR